MGRNFKSFALLVLFLSLSLVVFADTTNDATNGPVLNADKEVKPSEEIVPQQIGGAFCMYGCCFYGLYGCRRCCFSANEAPDAIVPQQRGGCRYGCCGSFAHGQCSACCTRPQVIEDQEAKEVVEPQQRRRGGCYFACCGSLVRGQCSACCNRIQAARIFGTSPKNTKIDVVEPQQRGRGGCRYGCCGSSAYGQCSACCPRKMSNEEEAKKEEIKA